MYYSQGTLTKINEDVMIYHDSKKQALASAKRMTKQNDYSAVWFGNQEERTKIK